MESSARAKDAAEDRHEAGIRARAAAAPQVTVTVWVSLLTSRSIMVTRDDGAEVWIPNSLLSAVPNTGRQTITLPEWKAKQEGLVP